MQNELSASVRPVVARPNLLMGVAWRRAAMAVAITIFVFLAVFNLTSFPTTWFDEGSHLHVPKTLIHFGTYADYSSEGFRYYGPTIGVGPTVMLPIAAAFRLFGIGLLQARVVMVVYLLAAVYVFYRLANMLGGQRLAWVTTALLVTSRGVALLENGRQVLGEVPGLFFLVAGLALWFAAWEKASWKRLALVGLLVGLAVVTKYQYLLILVPTLGLAWLANLIYYRTTPQRVFIVPGLVAGVCFALWQVYMILYLGPATASENLAALRTATAGAAMVFSPALMKRGLEQLLSLKVYLFLLLPALVYGFTRILPRRRDAQQWGILFVLIGVNFVWYVVASISWLRYAFLGLAVSSLFIARFVHDLTNGFQLDLVLRQGKTIAWKPVLRLALLAWLAVTLVVPLGQTARQIILPEANMPAMMAAYLDAHIPRDKLIETWEPEMGFLTDHNYHFPPALLLNKAVGYIWLGGATPAQSYDFVQTQHPAYVLVGGFARWVNLYPADVLAASYHLVTRIGGYELYAFNQ